MVDFGFLLELCRLFGSFACDAVFRLTCVAAWTEWYCLGCGTALGLRCGAWCGAWVTSFQSRLDCDAVFTVLCLSPAWSVSFGWLEFCALVVSLV